MSCSSKQETGRGEFVAPFICLIGPLGGDPNPGAGVTLVNG